MEIIVHTESSGEAEIVTVEETALVGSLVVEGSGHRVWIAEQVEEVQLDLSFVAVGIGQHHHVHKGRCHEIEIDVRYETEHKVHKVRPSATVGEVLDWAVGDTGFHLPSDQRPKYVLAVPGAQDYLSADLRVITLVETECRVHLNLLPKDHFGG